MWILRNDNLTRLSLTSNITIGPLPITQSSTAVTFLTLPRWLYFFGLCCASSVDIKMPTNNITSKCISFEEIKKKRRRQNEIKPESVNWLIDFSQKVTYTIIALLFFCSSMSFSRLLYFGTLRPSVLPQSFKKNRCRFTVRFMVEGRAGIISEMRC